MQTTMYFNDPDDVALPSSQFSWKSRLFWSLLFFGPATYFGFQGDVIAAAMCSIAGMSGFAGYRAGAFSIFAWTMALISAFVLAPSIGMENAHRFTQWFGLTGLANRFLSIGVVGLLIGGFIMASLEYVMGRVVRRRQSLDRWNRRLGFTLGVAQGVFGLACFIGGMLMMEPIELKRVDRRTTDDPSSRFASNVILSTADSTRQSVLGPYLVRYNPVAMIPAINRVEEFNRTAEVLSDPLKMGMLLNAPEIQLLRQRPQIQSLVDQLQTDPTVREMVESGHSMTPSAAMKLLNHPAIMQLVDQPGFLEEASKAIQNAVPPTGIAH